MVNAGKKRQIKYLHMFVMFILSQQYFKPVLTMGTQVKLMSNYSAILHLICTPGFLTYLEWHGLV